MRRYEATRQRPRRAPPTCCWDNPSMYRHAFGHHHVQRVSQCERHFFTEECHGKTLDAVGEASLDDNHSPTVIGFLNGAIGGFGGDLLTLRDNARAQGSPSRW